MCIRDSIYADRCSITEDKLAKMGVIFKKIPRDISKSVSYTHLFGMHIRTPK